jgi:hypothetical protein
MVLVAVQAASADEVTFVGSSGPDSASATFTSSGGNLIVTLTNTSPMDAMVPTDILTAVFFNAPGTLTPVSATVTAGSVVYGFPGVTNVGGEWTYNGSVGNSAPVPGGKGLSAVGFSDFGPPNIIDPSATLPGLKTQPGGLDFGIAPAGDNPATGNGGLAGRPLIQDGVTFVLSGWTGSLASITDVFFQYGTAYGEPGFPGSQTPEPASMVLLGIGAVGLCVARRRKNAAA